MAVKTYTHTYIHTYNILGTKRNMSQNIVACIVWSSAVWIPNMMILRHRSIVASYTAYAFLMGKDCDLYYKIR